MKQRSLIFYAALTIACFALPSFAPSTVPPQSRRSNFHFATTESCDAAQTQCVAACSSQSGDAQQNCISDCNDVRTTCQ